MVREATTVEIFQEEFSLFWELIIISITFATLSAFALAAVAGKESSGGSSARS
ncbi:hypothetical protein [Agriterribacter sp.]|uniref:hypothetical protein n=1 Tax=Agriterribacter sp. TaxID=2821509 RepID=UPI002C56A303|nr:hypothetical protein [Agriterribacter sp.]HRO47266.1 hypothetical protein [Agriterribacter sp.]HRQ19371.1 hypothetical protein [Agriterribacter sp.]